MKRTVTGALVMGAALVALPGSAQAQSAAKMAEGATVYGQQCVRCHNARSPAERTDREWLTIVNHMRARANLTRADAQALVVFLQAANGGPVPRALGSDDPGEGEPASSEKKVEGEKEGEEKGEGQGG